MFEIIELKVKPYHEIYYNTDSSFGIYACNVISSSSGLRGKITIKGSMMKLELEKEYNVSVTEQQDKKYGLQYEVTSIFQDIPTDPKKQKAYLKTILTDRQVENIYKVYPNEDVVTLIRENKFDYSKVHGIGQYTFELIQNKIIENLEFQEAFLFLSDYGVTNNLIIKLVRYFKSARLLIEKMKNNPYCITSVSGVGFKTADKIAMEMGYDPQGRFRILSAIEFVVDESSLEGNTYITTSNLVDKVSELLNIDTNLINEQIMDTDRVIVIGDKVALKRNYEAEKYVAKRLVEIFNNSTELDFDVDEFVKKQEEELGIKLTEQQKDFFENVKKYNVSSLVGYAGSGKSSMTKLLINLLEELNMTYRLVSPTGKAAKVLNEYTDRDAETIHRAIGLGVNEEDESQFEIWEEFLVIDEFSMVDAVLCERLLEKCMNNNLRVVFIGDDSQLASVGAGRLLYDIINSKTIPIAKLDIIFRQEEGGIIDIATKTRQGERYLSNNDWGIIEFGNDCTIACVPQEKIVGGYKYYFNELLKKYKAEEITIATPANVNKLGTIEINKTIQQIVNPKADNKAEKEYGSNNIVFREGDMVVNTRNMRAEDVNGKAVSIVNGDTGKIIKVDNEEKFLYIDFDFATVPFGFSKLNQLLHSWAMTTHRLQGSSNKAVILIADKSHKFQLNLNLLYTGITRAKEELVFLTQAETINFALRKQANLQRNTFLKDMLIEEYKNKINKSEGVDKDYSYRNL